MVLVTHIMLVLSSLALTTYLFIRPSRGKLYGSYGLLGATLASGTYLVVTTGAHLLQTCITGLAYIGAIAVGIIAAQRKLATQKALNRSK